MYTAPQSPPSARGRSALVSPLVLPVASISTPVRRFETWLARTLVSQLVD